MLKPFFNGPIRTILGPMLHIVLYKSPVDFGGILLAEYLQFLPLLPGQMLMLKLRLELSLRLLYMRTSTYYLEDSICYCNRHVWE